MSDLAEPSGPVDEQPCGSCGGALWVEDENWSPEYPEFWRGERAPGDGLNPCGTCNFGNWNSPWPYPGWPGPCHEVACDGAVHPCALVHDSSQCERRVPADGCPCDIDVSDEPTNELRRPTVTVQPCGTKAAYQRHVKRGETPCELCTAANSAHRRKHFAGTRERNRLYQQALRNANKRLQKQHPDTWRALLAEEMQRLEGL